MVIQPPDSLARWFRLVRFSHTLFALPFAVVGYCYGLVHSGKPFTLSGLLLMLGCMVFARSAAMAYNRLADRRIDALNPRTASREIPRGRVSVRQAAFFVIVSSLLFVLCCAALNRLVFLLSPVALAVVLLYSHTKHLGAWCHLWLGVALGLAPLGAYLAVTEAFHPVPILLGVGVMLWTAAFDAIYSLQDRDFDAEHGLHSIPVRLGRVGTLWASALMMLLALLFLFLSVRGMGLLPWGGWALLLFALVVLWQFLKAIAAKPQWLGSTYMLINGCNSLLLGVLLTLSLCFT